MGVNYLMKKRELSRILRWRGEKKLCCFRCGMKIKPGDLVHRNEGGCHPKIPGFGGKIKEYARFYHLSCYEGLFLDLKEGGT
jgi:hypothetical protein